jgi:hypothetical protein
LAHLYDPGCKALLDRISEKAKSESSGPLRGEMPEVVAASGSTGTILPKLPPPFVLKQKLVECGEVPLSRWAKLGERSGPRRSSELKGDRSHVETA